MPFPIILSSPSGGGKTTIAHKLLAMRPDVGYSVSCTTRPPRAGEIDGKDYHFLSLKEFKRGKAARKFAESAEVLVERLKARGTEDRKSLIRRFKSAKDELKAIDLYQYVIVNDEIDSAVAAVSSVIEAEGTRRSRIGSLDARLEELMDGIQRAIVQYSPRK